MVSIPMIVIVAAVAASIVSLKKVVPVGVSQKSQYALRALFELAKRREEGPVAVAEIAEAQAIPQRFLELIVVQLRKTGWIRSHRGAQGGYTLVVPQEQITVADIIRVIDGSLAPVKCISEESPAHCALKGRCAFAGLWKRARDAVAAVYESTTLQDMVEEELVSLVGPVHDYSI